ALVTGDPRMAHDPLRTQRRAVGVGVLLALLVAGGMLLVAMLRPAPSVGDAALVTDESGALHVRLGESFHPVTNVASARLLLGSAESPSKTTASN
ncbi:MAG TPA: type VII secretion protein EccB, partial [Corynebacterium variabile]|nr:type VII secretion protein EccB [Corynebacterium variabile]